MYQIGGLSQNENNVSFRIGIDNIDYFFRLHIFRGILYCSIWIDNYRIIDSVKCISGMWLLPYRYLALGGNFRFENSFDEYVTASDFARITRLCYYNREEYEEILKRK